MRPSALDPVNREGLFPRGCLPRSNQFSEMFSCVVPGGLYRAGVLLEFYVLAPSQRLNIVMRTF
jgi:hypothetical protein